MQRIRANMPLALLGLLLSGSSGCLARVAQPLPSASELARPRSNVAALEIDTADGVDAGEAGVIAVLSNAELVAARAARGEASAQLVAAGLLSNPVLSGGLSDPFGVGSAGAVSAVNLGLEWSLGSLIGRGARRDEGGARLESVDLEIAWREWQVAQAARIGVSRWALLQRRVKLVEDEVRFGASIVEDLETAVDAGDATVQALGVHVSALEAQRQLLGELRRARVEERSAALLLMGLAPDADIQPNLDAPDAAAWPALRPWRESLEAALGSRVDLLALQRGYEAQEARIRQAILAQIPALSIGLSGDRNESGLRFVGGFITLDLPFLDHGQAAIPLERATRERLRAEYLARVAAAGSDLQRFTALDALLGAQAASALAGIRSMEAIEGVEGEGVLAGDMDRRSWQEVRSALLDLRLRLLDLYGARLDVRAALEIAGGSSLGSLGPEVNDEG